LALAVEHMRRRYGRWQAPGARYAALARLGLQRAAGTAAARQYDGRRKTGRSGVRLARASG
jgi:hypothetical protein